MRKRLGLLLLLCLICVKGVCGDTVPADKTPLLPGGIELPLIFVRAPRGSDEGTGITRDFYMGQFEITNGQWQALTGSTPTGESGDPESPDFLKPATNMTQDEAVNFAKTLGDYLCAEYPEDFAGAALPTSDQWKYACAAGTRTEYYWGDDPDYTAIDDYAWYNANANGMKQPVGGKLPNAWGLYDTSGNVAEWIDNRDSGCWWPDPPYRPYGLWETAIWVHGGSCDSGPWDCASDSLEVLQWTEIIEDCPYAGDQSAWFLIRSDFVGLRVVVFPAAEAPTSNPYPIPVEFEFARNGEGWRAFGWPPFDSPIFATTIGSPGTLDMTAIPSTELVGIWRSPSLEVTEAGASLNIATNIPLSIEKAEGQTVFRASCRITCDEEDPGIVPTIRIRTTAENSQQSDVLVIESNAGGAYSPGPNGRQYDLYFSPPATSSIFSLHFDMLNFTPRDSQTATLRLDQVSISPVPDYAFLQSREEKIYDFSEGTNDWQYFGIPEAFASPVFSYDQAGQRLVASPSDADEFQFGFWGSSLESSNNVTIEPHRMYYGIFTVGSDLVDPQLAPTFRLRMNESLFRACAYTVIAPTGQALNTPTLGVPRDYTVYFPPDFGVETSLLSSFDFLADPEHALLDRNGSLFLERVQIRSVPTEITMMLPGNVPLTFLPVPPGLFLMGCYPGEEAATAYEVPQHWVEIGYSFYMAKFELTKGQWEAVMGTQPWAEEATNVPHYSDQPANYISWDDAQMYISTLNSYLYASGQGEFQVRLPSEAEWEYVCRAGTTTRYYWGDDPNYEDIDEYAWYNLNSGEDYSHAVGQKPPNRWGFHDMSGSIREWCQDEGHFNYNGAPPTDGSAWEDGSGYPEGQRVFRGGSYSTMRSQCRSAFRYPYCCPPEAKHREYGFRLVGYWDVGGGGQ
ncbi:formylglycine-generating enzyme family protein [bacterium]|nr:formylglycine-generating enzyme family protein [bacterium]